MVKKKKTLLRLIKLYKVKKGMLVFSIILVLITMGIDLYLPRILGDAINYFESVIKYELPIKEAFRTFIDFAMLFLLSAMLLSLFRFRQWYTISKLRMYILHYLRCKIYGKIQEMEFGFFDDKPTGELISVATRDMERARMFYGEVIFMGIEISLYIIGSFIMILYLDIKLSIVALSTTPITIFFVTRYAKNLLPKWRASNDQYDYINSTLDENITGVKVVKSFNREIPEIKKFNGFSEKYVDKCFSAFNYWATRMPTMELMFGICIPLSLAYGGYLVIKGNLLVGDLSTCLFLLINISQRLRPLGRIIEMTQIATSSGDRIFEVLDRKPAILDSDKTISFPDGSGNVRFENVRFSYNGNKKILDSVNFEVKAGETVAIVGSTGSGKSSLVGLLSRFYDPDDGRIYIDGVDIKQVALEDLRKHISLVFQETFLFSGTISENIAYGKPDVSQEDIEKYARIAQADEFISKFPKGYETIIGERGVDLSGGQKQRVAIARALLTNPRVLVMDDCTASVDSDTEVKIQKAMKKLNAKRTTFIISQRISTIKQADRIIVLDSGKLVQMGTHDELINQKGVYRNIFQDQTEDAAA